MYNLNQVLAALRAERNRAQHELQNLDAAIRTLGSLNGKGPTRKISAAGRARIAAAQRARWAKVHRAQGSKPRRRTMSLAARQRIAAAQRARWAKVKSQQA